MVIQFKYGIQRYIITNKKRFQTDLVKVFFSCNYGNQWCTTVKNKTYSEISFGLSLRFGYSENICVQQIFSKSAFSVICGRFGKNNIFLETLLSISETVSNKAPVPDEKSTYLQDDVPKKYSRSPFFKTNIFTSVRREPTNKNLLGFPLILLIFGVLDYQNHPVIHAIL